MKWENLCRFFSRMAFTSGIWEKFGHYFSRFGKIVIEVWSVAGTPVVPLCTLA